jgi:hypothetical protein
MTLRLPAESRGHAGFAPAFLHVFLWVATLLASCTKVDQTAGGAAAGAEAATKRPAGSMLAYEHEFSVLLAPDDIAPRFEAVRAAERNS